MRSVYNDTWLASANLIKRLSCSVISLRKDRIINDKTRIRSGIGRDNQMMPLLFANVGEENIIKKVGGTPEVKKHLENLRFVAGGSVTVINTIAGNLIVNVKEARVAISKEMAQKIMV